MGYLDDNGLAHLWGKIAAALSGKQNALTGTEGQVVGFDEAGNAVAVDMPTGGDGSVTWEDINGRPDLSGVVKLTNAEITLSASFWNDSNEQTATIPDILDDETRQLITPVPSSASYDAYYQADIRVIQQADGSLTFKCFGNLPTENVTVYVYIQETTEPKKEYVKYVWWSPEMTSDNTPAPYVAAASSILSANDPAWYAFDGIIDTNNTNYWHTTGSDYHPWISFYFGQKTRINGVSITARNLVGYPQLMPSHGVIEGSNDGSNWTEIASFSGWERLDNGRTEEILFDNPAEYSYYRIADMDDGYVGFSEVKFYRREREVTE